MDTVQLIGIRHCAFYTEDGSEIRGTNLYYLLPITGSGEGQRGEKTFVSDSVDPCRFHPGDTVTIVYNRYGKCAKVILE